MYDERDIPGIDGFRFCNSLAKTILDPLYQDEGDFTSVAVYVDRREVVLKS
jgi:hypothetical protein